MQNKTWLVVVFHDGEVLARILVMHIFSARILMGDGRVRLAQKSRFRPATANELLLLE